MLSFYFIECPLVLLLRERGNGRAAWKLHDNSTCFAGTYRFLSSFCGKLLKCFISTFMLFYIISYKSKKDKVKVKYFQNILFCKKFQDCNFSSPIQDETKIWNLRISHRTEIPFFDQFWAVGLPRYFPALWWLIIWTFQPNTRGLADSVIGLLFLGSSPCL